MSLEAGALQVGGARKRSDHGEGGNHGNPASRNHEKGNVTLKQSVKYLHVYQPDTNNKKGGRVRNAKISTGKKRKNGHSSKKASANATTRSSWLYLL